jgi:ribonuclease Z
MNITLALHSSPRFSTWIWAPDWRLLIDAGDGATAQLGYKIRKIDTVLLTHAHRDHIGGLLQVINQRGEAGPFAVAHPSNGRSWRMLENFSLRCIPGNSEQALWRPLEAGEWVDTGVEGRPIQSFRTRHYTEDLSEGPPRSLGYHLIWRKQKVRPEYRDLPQSALDDLRAHLGREGITAPVDEKIITIGGDGVPLAPEEVQGTNLLLHEATFLSPEDYDVEDAQEEVGHMHSTVRDALVVAHEAGVPQLVLYHISTRYTDQEIREAVRQVAGEIGCSARVWAALPRRIYWDILKEKPLWEGN